MVDAQHQKEDGKDEFELTTVGHTGEFEINYGQHLDVAQGVDDIKQFRPDHEDKEADFDAFELEFEHEDDD